MTTRPYNAQRCVVRRSAIDSLADVIIDAHCAARDAEATECTNSKELRAYAISCLELAHKLIAETLQHAEEA